MRDSFETDIGVHLAANLAGNGIAHGFFTRCG
jgi:hypothetical protein